VLLRVWSDQVTVSFLQLFFFTWLLPFLNVHT
jgi:hypothetical protein